MKVICIDNSGYESELSLNKEYTAYENAQFKIGYYSIDNDLGDKRTYKKRRFVPVFKNRVNIIESLLS